MEKKLIPSIAIRELVESSPHKHLPFFGSRAWRVTGRVGARKRSHRISEMGLGWERSGAAALVGRDLPFLFAQQCHDPESSYCQIYEKNKAYSLLQDISSGRSGNNTPGATRCAEASNMRSRHNPLCSQKHLPFLLRVRPINSTWWPARRQAWQRSLVPRLQAKCGHHTAHVFLLASLAIWLTGPRES